MSESIFGTDPHKLARTDDPDTSHEAARLVDTKHLEHQVYVVIESSGLTGIISDDVRKQLQHIISYSSVTARYKALKEKGLIKYNGELRPGRSGRNQHVMVATKHELFI